MNLPPRVMRHGKKRIAENVSDAHLFRDLSAGASRDNQRGNQCPADGTPPRRRIDSMILMIRLFIVGSSLVSGL